MRNYNTLLNNIEKIDKDKKIVIYPFGAWGQLAKGILNGLYDTQEYMIVDKYLSQKDKKFSSFEDLKDNVDDDIIVLIVTDWPSAHDEIAKAVKEICQIINMWMSSGNILKMKSLNIIKTVNFSQNLIIHN